MTIAKFNPEAADTLVRIAVFAADHEFFRVMPVSRVRNWDGSLQPETGAEARARVVNAAVKHLLEQGLVVIPDGIRERLEQPVPMARQGSDPVSEDA